MKARRILTAIGVAAALLIGPATMANAYEGNGYSVKVSVRTQVAGKAITVTVKVPAGVKNVRIRVVCPAIYSSQITIAGEKEVVKPVGPGGIVTANVTVVSACGCYIEVFNADTGMRIGGQIPVTFTAPESAGPGLPMTGSDVAPIAIGAGVLLAGGATAVTVSRKRRRA